MRPVWWAGDWLKAVPNCLLKDNDLMRLSAAIKTWYLVDYFMDNRLYLLVCTPLKTVDIIGCVYPWNTVLPWIMAFIDGCLSPFRPCQPGPGLILFVWSSSVLVCDLFCNFGCIACDFGSRTKLDGIRRSMDIGWMDGISHFFVCLDG